MKAVNSSSYSSPSLHNIMIPQFQQLLPLETNLSGNWLNTNYSSEPTNKLLSPPNSITPSSVCTDLSESEYQPMDLSSSSRKYSYSSPPLSNVKSESIDSSDSSTLYIRQDPTMVIPNNTRLINSSFKKTKQCSNFSIEHLLSSSSRSPTYSYLAIGYNRVNSIFTKKKVRHYSEKYLHQIITHRKQLKHKKNSSHNHQSIPQRRRLFLRYLFNIYNDLILQQNQIKTEEKLTNIDPLEQLADLACKLATHQKELMLNEDLLTPKNIDLLLKQSYFLIKQVYQKHQYKKHRKRLNLNLKLKFKNRFLNLFLANLNLLLKKSTHHSYYHILMSDIPIKNEQPIKSICNYLRADEIISNFEILLPNNGLLYEAMIIQPVDNFDDLFLVRLNHERQTYLIPIHDLCRLACPKMIPTDFNNLSKGLRVCAYWSTSLRGLHPAIVKKVPSADIDESSMVTLVFDDGDSGLIKLDEIRLLPDDYDVKGINLEEWRVSSSQLASSLSTSRRTSRRISSSSASIKSIKRAKSSSSIVVPQWTLNLRNSTICRHDKKQTIHIGDCIILHGVDKTLSYIGKVLKIYHNKSTKQDMVRLKWYYSPQETPIGLQDNDLPGAVYESTHIDENPISTVRYKGTIYQSYDDYVKKTDYGKKRKETDFYLVGHFNPTSGKLQRYDKK